MVSTSGGHSAKWPRAGKRLCFGTLDNRVMHAEYTVEADRFVPAAPRSWSDAVVGNAGGVPNFDVSPDGKRLMASPIAESPAAQGNLHLTFLLNFFDERKRRVP